MPFSISSHAASDMLPARFSAQYFHTSDPDPSAWPRQSPRSIGPAGRKTAGRFMLIAPISKRGRRLVAPAHQHRAVGRVRAQQLLGLHRQQVAIEHRRRLLERLGQRDRRHLDRKSARLPDAALHFLGALAEVRVARIDVAPRVDDRDNGLADVFAARIAHLRGARAVRRTSAGRRRRTSGASAARPRACDGWSWVYPHARGSRGCAAPLMRQSSQAHLLLRSVCSDRDFDARMAISTVARRWPRSGGERHGKFSWKMMHFLQV